MSRVPLHGKGNKRRASELKLLRAAKDGTLLLPAPGAKEEVPERQPTNADLFRSLGILEAKFEILVKDFERERDAAESHRSGLSETIAAMAESVRALTGRMDVLGGKVDEMKPVLNEYQANAYRASGAFMVGRWVWIVVAATFATIGTIVGFVISAWHHA